MFYYSADGKQMGPVSKGQLDEMVRSRALGMDTLVWREGMSKWETYAKVMGAGFPTSTMVPCSVCKTLVAVENTVRIGEAMVCADCKPKFLQQMREGVVSSGKGLYQIALNQRKALMWIGALFVCNLAQTVMAQAMTAPTVAAGVFSLAWLVILVFAAVAMYRLARSVGLTAILYAILLIVPCMGLLLALVAVSRATQKLRDGGVKVGLFGVSKETLEQLKQSGA